MGRIFYIIKSAFKAIYLFIFGKSHPISASRLNTYLTCPLKYRYEYIDRIEKKPSHFISFGSTIHNILFYIFSNYTKERIINMKDKELGRIFNSFWISDGYENKELEDEYRVKGWKMIKNYIDGVKNNFPNIVKLEELYSIEMDGITINGRFDRVDCEDGKYFVVDYKSGDRIPDEDTLKSDIQANIYWIIANETWKNRLGGIYFNFLSSSKVIKIPYNEEAIKATKKLIKDTYMKIYSGEFPAKRGPLCGWCEYFKNCSAWKKERKKYNLTQFPLFRVARETNKIGLSYSKLGLFTRCPRAYRKIYLERIPPKPKHFFSIGETIHKTMEELYEYRGYGTPELKWILNTYEKNWVSKGYKSKEYEMWFFNEGKKWLTNYYEKFVKGRFKRAFRVEEYFEIPVDGHVLIGLFDRIDENEDGSFSVIDYKTDPKVRTQEDVDKDMQLSIYYWAMREVLGLKVKDLSLIFIRFPEVVTTTRDDSIIPDLKSFVRSKADEMVDLQIKLMDYMKHIVELKKIEFKPTGNIFKDFLTMHNKIIEAGYTEYISVADEIFEPRENKYCKSCDFLEDCKLKSIILGKKEEPPEPVEKIQEVTAEFRDASAIEKEE